MAMPNKYDIFISYRREGADFLAQLLYERLSHMGYSVFFDVESLRSGKFNEALYKYMDGCTDAIVLLPPNALDRCVNDEDWVRKEISYLIKKQKNIIPVMMRGFMFPNNLPYDMEDFDKYNGISAQEVSSFSWVIDQLVNKFLKSTPRTKDSPKTMADVNFDNELGKFFDDQFKDARICDNNTDDISLLNQKLYEIKAKNYQKQINAAMSICNERWASVKSNYAKQNYVVFPHIEGFETAVFQICLQDDYYTLSRYFDFTEIKLISINQEQLSCFAFNYKCNNHLSIKDLLIVMSCKKNGEVILLCPELVDNLLTLNSIPEILKYKDILTIGENRNELKYCEDQNKAVHSKLEANLNEEVCLVLDPETLKPIAREIIRENGNVKAYITIEQFKSYICLQVTSGCKEKVLLSNSDIASNYQYGKNGFPLDISKAIEYYQKDNSGESLYKISQIFRNDNIYNDDIEYRLYLKAAVQKNYSKAIAETIFNSYKENGCIINAEIANQINDDAEVQRSLNIYSNYLINNKKYDDAFNCLKMTATTCNSIAISNLGYMYKNGYGCSVDYTKARELFEESMKMGSYGPYSHLAEMYEHGLGVKKDKKKAYEYYKTGAKLGNERCIEWIKNNSYVEQ